MLLNNTQFTKETSSMYTKEDVAKILTKRVPNIGRVDSYKGEHWSMLHQDNEFSNAYIAARKGDFVCPAGIVDAVVNILDITITPEMINIFEMFFVAHGGELANFNRIGWEGVVKDHGGKMPLEVKGVREGSLVGIKTPVINVRNTAPGYGWLVNYFIDSLLRIWKATEVSTLALDIKVELYAAAKMTGATEEEIIQWLPWALHDFGLRSAGGTTEEAANAGLGHIPHFSGSDNWEATWVAHMLYSDTYSYDATLFRNLPTGSVFAMEHNIVLSFDKDDEHQMLLDYACYLLRDGRIGSILIDTYNIDKAMDFLTKNIHKMREAWLKGGKVGKVVFRPDSGDAIETPIMVANRLLEAVAANGEDVDNSEFRRLPPYLGVIQGDKVNKVMIHRFALYCKEAKLSVLNFVFGMGGELLGAHTRDKSSWSGKVNAYETEEEVRKVCKTPIGAPGKKTLEGYHTVCTDDLIIGAVPVENYDEMKYPHVYYKDGLVFSTTLDELREEADKTFFGLLEKYGYR